MISATETATTTDPQTVQAVTKEIAETFSEPKAWLIKRVVQEIGAERLKTNQEDELIVEGYSVFEPKMQGMAVLAQSVTTKGMEQERRAKKASKETQPPP